MPIQRTFAAGEVAPEHHSGGEPAIYARGLATCRNFIVTRHGTCANRPGTQFLAEVKDSTKTTSLLKFVFSDSETYVLEFGDFYVRFYQNAARVTVSGVAAWSGATTYVVGDIVSNGGINYYCILGHINQAPPNATYWYPLSGNILEIPTPYAAGETPDLRVAQTGDILTIVHPSYAVYELRRFQSRWTLAAATFAPVLPPPANLNAAAGTAGSLVQAYVVTAVQAGDYEESLPSSSDSVNCSDPTPSAPNSLTWDAVVGAVEYNVYVDRYQNGVFYFLGIAASNSFNDVGLPPDESLTPPVAQTVFNSAGNYPAAVTFYQQRRVFGGSTNEPEKVRASQTGFFKNFTVSSPIQNDDAVSFTIAGKIVGAIRHLAEVGGKLVIGTSAGEWAALGDSEGVLLPTAQNLRQQSYYGSAKTPAAVVGNNLVYVQSRGALVRDLRFNLNADAYEGRELTRGAAHLVEGHQLTRLDYAQIPDSILWAIRDDGVLLGLTYQPESELWGWHRHDTADGEDRFEDVCTVPESIPAPVGSSTGPRQEDGVYVIVRRTINGVSKRYVERLASRRVENITLDAYFLDSFLTYNGINNTATTVTLTTVGGWTTADEITVTASSAIFTAGDVGNGVTVVDPGVVVTRINITTFVSGTVVKGNPISTVPSSLRNVATPFWSRAVDEVSGLGHLEGEAVSILANGVVFSGTVSSGTITLPNVYDVIHVGLPIKADFETLDLEADQDGFRDRKKLVKSASLLVLRSRGILAGPDADHLQPYFTEIGDVLGLDIFTPSGAFTLSRIAECPLNATWQKEGRVFVRQTEPLPLTILAVMPNGELGG